MAATQEKKMLQTLEINPEASPHASIIWLHGLGASGYDFYDIVPHLNLSKDLGVRFVFPHAPVRSVDYAGGEKMRAWFNIFELGDSEQTPKEDILGIKESEKLINRLIEKELEQNIPSNKIILVGFSQGGAMALQCGLRYPKTLGGILVLSAWLPLTQTINSEKNIANIKTPILMLHGTEDQLIPLGLAIKSYDQLKKLGFCATLYSYPMQHTVCPEEINTIGNWINKVLA